MRAYEIGWNAGIVACTQQPGLNLEQRLDLAREVERQKSFKEYVEIHYARAEFIKGFLAGYAQSQVYKDMPAENRQQEAPGE